MSGCRVVGFREGLVRRLRLHVLGWAAHRMVPAIILGIAAASFGLPLVLPPLRLADETSAI